MRTNFFRLFNEYLNLVGKSSLGLPMIKPLIDIIVSSRSSTNSLLVTVLCYSVITSSSYEEGSTLSNAN